MSARPLLTLIDRRADAVPIHAFLVGKRLGKASDVFKRKDEAIKCDHTNSLSDAVEIVTAQARTLPFDCVLVDARDNDDDSLLHIVNMATLGGANLLAVIARPEDMEMLENLPGVHRVLQDPVGAKEVISIILESLPESDEIIEDVIVTQDVADEDFVPADYTIPAEAVIEVTDAPVEMEPDDATAEQDVVEVKSEVTKGFESSLSKLQEVDQGIWQRFVPLANFVYKKLAILVLTALFLTFMSYGAMIVFFLGSSSWSLPFELSKGHKLVEKVERDLSSMNLRRNGISQDLTSANQEKSAALRNTRDGELQLILSKRTIEEEIVMQKEEHTTIEMQITRYKQVIKDFTKLNGNGKFARSLKGAYSKRLITRNTLNSGTLAVLETMHRIATLQNETAMKRLDLHRVEGRLSFLNSLLIEVDKPEIGAITSPSSDLAHLAREAIQAKNIIATSKSAVNSAEKRISRLENSLGLISSNINSLEATPAARAIQSPVMVLFVPYTNADKVFEGQPLYSCAVSIVWCSEIGKVGAQLAGETPGVHPLFGKPLRGTFVEAKFFNPRSVTEDLIHAGSPPMGF
ncbi:MAG: hypothetical protein V3V02_08420 [Rhizobiaceae bacterium]